MGTPNKYTVEMCEQAEKILSTGKSLAAVCASMNIGRSTLYEWRDNHSEFREAIERGLQKAQAYWEDVGLDGITGEIKSFGAAPWIFTMKNRFRDDYKEDKDSNKGESAVEKFLLSKLVE